MSALSTARVLAIIETQSASASASIALDGVIALVASRAQEITGAAAGVVELLEGDEMVHHAVSGTAAPLVGVRSAVKGSLSGLCVLQNDVLLCDNAEDDPRVDREACRRLGARSMLCVPLVHGKQAVGVLTVYHPDTNAFGDADVATVRILSGIIATAMAHAGDFELRRYESRHDALTGLPNRRAFDDHLEREIARASRYRGKLTLCLADVDAVRVVNDRHGHAAGDAVLRAVAAILKGFRDIDQAFRFGDDEFAVIFPGVDYVNARTAVRRAQTAVEREPACLGVGLSWGLADISVQDANTLVMRADAARYKAKQDRQQAVVPPDAQDQQIASGAHSSQR
jgi:diguanylate cyclase